MSKPTATSTLPLSAVFITLNAASQLEAALRSVAFCQDIVVVDSGSTDNTIALAEQYGARVVFKEWLGFGPQKQFAVAQARFDWVLCLDADERVSPSLMASIQEIFSGSRGELDLPGIAAFDMPRCNFFMGRYLRHGEGYPDWSRRLFHRARAGWSNDAVHEKVEVHGGLAVQRLHGDLLHESAETLQSYLTKQNRYTTIQAEQLVIRGKRPGFAKLVLSPWVRFIKFYLVRRGFLDGWPGFVHIVIGCFNSFVKYAKARDMMDR
ncbi:glycosyltransferase family 2 protein [Limnobacter humi]|uniref:Glycosyltransferase family 2 protein n=1 Tax=Limnobacter humi TaxID=1778671 RepID=A0ABT1WCG4_9BURK|nr:glycosyltransferase family 2 protein [Limnobacter humi]MCQ8895190.1 glycosyltransferase family 2 protein [Limnobacter humi]